MIVTIVSYNQVKGKGVYRTASGDLVDFSYTQFDNFVMIPPGSKATLIGGVLYSKHSPWKLLVKWLKEKVNGYRS